MGSIAYFAGMAEYIVYNNVKQQKPRALRHHPSKHRHMKAPSSFHTLASGPSSPSLVEDFQSVPTSTLAAPRTVTAVEKSRRMNKTGRRKRRPQSSSTISALTVVLPETGIGGAAAPTALPLQSPSASCPFIESRLQTETQRSSLVNVMIRQRLPSRQQDLPSSQRSAVVPFLPASLSSPVSAKATPSATSPVSEQWSAVLREQDSLSGLKRGKRHRFHIPQLISRAIGDRVRCFRDDDVVLPEQLIVRPFVEDLKSRSHLTIGYSPWAMTMMGRLPAFSRAPLQAVTEVSMGGGRDGGKGTIGGDGEGEWDDDDDDDEDFDELAYVLPFLTAALGAVQLGYCTAVWIREQRFAKTGFALFGLIAIAAARLSWQAGLDAYILGLIASFCITIWAADRSQMRFEVTPVCLLALLSATVTCVCGTAVGFCVYGI
eukprot:TRINITY_DN618_c0_g1_i1.p1 TRINITY_DN618_c0_g1~~TRINITY_DN618_c0_g1_i1.p1  ORF type:complete len:432 (+),score=46.69 TRINITY_DN618_c0_g1_i1:363-1658(+)